LGGRGRRISEFEAEKPSQKKKKKERKKERKKEKKRYKLQIAVAVHTLNSNTPERLRQEDCKF
jgi:Na+-transporting methylmalonyl-CoA/oxaloacetate decarboxylase gamma subunit